MISIQLALELVVQALSSDRQNKKENLNTQTPSPGSWSYSEFYSDPKSLVKSSISSSFAFFAPSRFVKKVIFTNRVGLL